MARILSAAEGFMGYPVHLEPDDNQTWLVSFPDFPEAHTFGETRAAALERAAAALETVIAAYRVTGRELPPPSGGDGPSVGSV